MARKEKPQIVNIESILANPSDKAKLMGFLDEAVICKEKIADQQESIRAIRDEALQQVGLAPKLFNQLLAISYTKNPMEKQDEIHSLDAAIEILFASDV